MNRLMNLLIITMSCVGFSGLANAAQPGYSLCSNMVDAEQRIECLKTVRGATRPYSEALLTLISQLADESEQNQALLVARDRLFPEGVLEVCAPDAASQTLTEFLSCLKTAGNFSPKYKNEYSHSSSVWAKNYNSKSEAVNSVIASTKKFCRGWNYYQFMDAKWKSKDCWSTTQNYKKQSYTLAPRQTRTRKGTPYTTWDIAPITKTYRYTYYHCDTSYRCFNKVKDFSGVEDQQK